MFSSFKKILQAKSYKQETCRGFSLLELIVVMAIFLIITAVVIADIPNFRQKSSLDLTANEVATYIRGGQVFGISQKGGVVKYGLHFEKNNSNFFLFSGDTYNPTSIVERYEMKGFHVESNYIRNLESGFCSLITPDVVDIIFSSSEYTSGIGTKLEPTVLANSMPVNNLHFVDLEITPVTGSGASGLKRCVRVYVNGQITLTSCDSNERACP